MGQGGALTLLTGVAGAGKTTLLGLLVDAWKSDTRYSPGGRGIGSRLEARRRPEGCGDRAGLCDDDDERSFPVRDESSRRRRLPWTEVPASIGEG